MAIQRRLQSSRDNGIKAIPWGVSFQRIQVILDINQPLRDKKSVTLPGGRVEYERVKKKCFHCLRLSHEKQKCSLLQGNRNKGKGILARQEVVVRHAPGERPHHSNLVDKLMPILAPSIPPGFEPSPSIVVPEVFEQMRIYMSCVDPKERRIREARMRMALQELRIREARMRMTLQELSKDPIAHRSCLRLERAPVVYAEMNKDRGRVFDFSRVNTEAVHDAAESSSHGLLRQPERRVIGVASEGIENEQIRRMGDPWIEAQRERINETRPMSHHQKDDGYIADKEEGLQLDAEGIGGFVMGSGFSGKADRSSKNRRSRSSRSSWVRRNRTCLKEHLMFLVNPVGLSGGLALFWKPSFHVEVLSSSNRIIDTKVKAGNIDYFMTFVYGDHVRQRRHEIMNGHEKLGGPDRIESSFYQFRSMARSCRIKEIPSSGERLSWAGVREVITNGVKENVWIQCRLDRAFGNAEWFRIFPRSHVRYLERLGSDHRPIFMSMSAQTQQRRGRFIFDKRWSSQPAVNEIIKKRWKPVVRPEGHGVSSVISSCRKELAKWARALKQKCKNKWLVVGDLNTKVFHEIAVQYFTNLFQFSSPADATELLQGMGTRVIEQMSTRLTKEVTDAEIKRAVKAIKSDSTPGASFLQRRSSPIGMEFYTTISTPKEAKSVLNDRLEAYQPVFCYL
ncbi:hypothetical protein Bca52824_082795 [Brassica carinata]|uniref:Uncharacterized protein n=1 Tax=Brassica carinata TaxID=52824 RepID=A0A8X7TSY2_BRACI|nr:hypothetical protein Bca52824_082795 [Brassica carinata]